MKVMLKKVRIAFPQLFEAKSVNQGKPRYGASFVFPKNHPVVKEIQTAMEKVGNEKWGAKWPQVKKSMYAAQDICLRDGDTKAQYEGFEGNLFVSAGQGESRGAPVVYDQSKNRVMKDNGMIYAGCYVNAQIDVWAQDNGNGKRINASLVAVQFNSDGDAFTARTTVDENDFDDVSVSNDEAGEFT